ncbi:hypothetical protein [Mycobacteroides abscessus]|uniref:hypothetical protein n=1 Tax=Mycobacteroides abscessus TaxID=36809 RepID=UPI0009297FEE|nr:hypothetical protein [Mycobacteroides abscessus]SHQ88866.1 Uncharacterised protein [Mycobacteroides abscessus subsp. bolletii]SHR74124.1 Uncharacterised protein [Mycobacteroides abscessus subsp. bolletii]SHT17411.1 Uncharacterised protein [Mycobacteroides abscessus subsp. bolletii]SKG04719.1 Uncharacterised protein [Mycobacteroides abscessus subsp. bolletii]SKG72104.1 Uncharacterised protein [Mycobacteroides abscessus subsp. bolletii]
MAFDIGDRGAAITTLSPPRHRGRGRKARVGVGCEHVAAAAQEVRRAEAALHAAVAHARQLGDTWAAIGAALGTTRQGARKRFNDADTPR